MSHSKGSETVLSLEPQPTNVGQDLCDKQGNCTLKQKISGAQRPLI